jgi:hypothetical protein
LCLFISFPSPAIVFVVLHPLLIGLFGGGDPAATALSRYSAIQKAIPIARKPRLRSIYPWRFDWLVDCGPFDLQSTPASVTTGDATASSDCRNKGISDLVMTNREICEIRSEEGGSGNTMALYLTIADRLVIFELLAKQLLSISSPHLP